MSLERLHVGRGQRLASVLSGCANGALGFVACFGACYMLTYVAIDGGGGVELVASALLLGILAAGGQLMIRLALGPHRTGGSVARFTRYQLSSAGIGFAIGIVALPLLLQSEGAPPFEAPYGVAVCIGVGAVVGLPSLLGFFDDRRRPGRSPAKEGQTIVPGTVVCVWERWIRTPGCDIAVVRYTGPDGRRRHLRHLPRQMLTVEGVVGEAHVDLADPERVTAFWVPSAKSKRALDDIERRERRLRAEGGA